MSLDERMRSISANRYDARVALKPPPGSPEDRRTDAMASGATIPRLPDVSELGGTIVPSPLQGLRSEFLGASESAARRCLPAFITPNQSIVRSIARSIPWRKAPVQHHPRVVPAPKPITLPYTILRSFLKLTTRERHELRLSS